eukprot:1137344-Pelagomonas_calceolata.AAC.2
MTPVQGAHFAAAPISMAPAQDTHMPPAHISMAPAQRGQHMAATQHQKGKGNDHRPCIGMTQWGQQEPQQKAWG